MKNQEEEKTILTDEIVSFMMFECFITTIVVMCYFQKQFDGFLDIAIGFLTVYFFSLFAYIGLALAYNWYKLVFTFSKAPILLLVSGILFTFFYSMIF